MQNAKCKMQNAKCKMQNGRIGNKRGIERSSDKSGLAHQLFPSYAVEAVGADMA
jgi:hypothetical protein